MDTPDITAGRPEIPVKGMSTVTGGIIGTFIGVTLGMVAFYWWQSTKIPKDSKIADTGSKTSDGKTIIEVTGIGGNDSGVKVKGYVLPENVQDITLPITVVVRPNQTLFLEFNAGQKLTFTRRRNDELIWIQTKGNYTGEYSEWYPSIRKKVLGVV